MKASCQCGQLRAEVPGATEAVVACHCRSCQKRSGSPFGVAAYYPLAKVGVAGVFREFSRPTDAGGTFTHGFCPDCGTTVFMRGTKNPDVTGIPIGCFDEPHGMRPIRSVWEEHRHAWVEIAPALQHFPRGRVG
jgi:hypothetical protein